MLRSILILLFCVCLVLGAPVDERQARLAAEHFIARQQSLSSLSLFKTSSDHEMTCDAVLHGYVARLGDKGFVLLAADSDLQPVIAWSLHHSWKDVAAYGVDDLLQADLLQRMSTKIQLSKDAIARNNGLWQRLSNPLYEIQDGAFEQWPPPGSTPTGGWVSTTWHQNEPYNRFCPLDPVTGSRTPVGCVGTVMAQLVNYHRQTGGLQLNLNDRYVTVSHGIHIDQDSLVLGFPSIGQLDQYLENIAEIWSGDGPLGVDEISALNMVCAMLLKMDFAQGNSGTYSGILPRVLVQRLGFKSAQYMEAGEELYQRLRENMLNAMPAHLSINQSIATAGHSILVDGYNTDGFFHVNFGWGEYYPGPVMDMWYHIPEYMGAGFDVLQKGTVDILPATGIVSAVSFSDSVLFLTPARVGNTSQLSQITLTNTGSDSAFIDRILVTDVFTAGYTQELQSTELAPDTLVPGGSLDLWVQCQPDSFGRFEGSLMFHDSHAGLWNAASLVGYGIPDKATLVDSSVVSGNWSKENSPYCIFNSCSVSAGDSLVLDAGTGIVFLRPLTLQIGSNAQILCQGTESDSIVFRALDVETGWHGLRFVNSGDDDTLRYCIIKDGNSTDADGEDSGGAITVESASPCFEHTRFTDNRAIFGSAAALHESGARFYRCSIDNNQAEVGTFYITGGTSLPVFENCIIDYNNAYYGVVAEVQTGADLSLINCTVTQNSSGSIRGAISLNRDNNVLLENSIFYNNNLSSGQAMWSAFENRVSLRYCLLDTFSGYWDLSMSGLSHTGLVYGNPQFRGMNTRDYRLFGRSPAIDAGDPNSDVGAEPFPHGFRTNLGAWGGTEMAAFTSVPRLAIVPDPVDFGRILSAENSDRVLKLRNGCRQALNVTAISLVDSSRFALGEYSLPIRIDAGASDSVQIVLNTKDILTGTLRDTLVVDVSGMTEMVPVNATVYQGTDIDTAWVWGTWDAAHQPYTIYSDIKIPAMRTLSIGPGVTVAFANGHTLTVDKYARLQVNGSNEAPVVFCAQESDQTWGGTSFLDSGADDTLRYCHIRDVDGSGNSQRHNSGAVYMDQSNPVLLNCKISGCNGQYGGGMYCRSSLPVLKHCRLVSNNASRYGGAMYLDASAPQLYQTLICHNTSHYDGGGISLYNHSNTACVNVTLTHNHTDGRGGNIYLQSGSDISFMNCIVGQAEGRYGNNVYMDRGVNPTRAEFDYCCVDTLAGWIIMDDPQDNDLMWGEGNIVEGPLFLEGNGDYLLTGLSPCIDAGNPSPVYSDVPDPLNAGNALYPARGSIRNDMGYTGGDGCTKIEFELLHEGWHLLSMPMLCESYQLSALYPKADDWYVLNKDSQTYSHVQDADSIHGFWIHAGAGKQEAFGVPIYEYTVSCGPGWNLLGSVFGDIPVTDILVEPEQSVLAVWQWSAEMSRFVPAETIETGKGYWFAVNEACDITLSIAPGERGRGPEQTGVLLKLFMDKYGPGPPVPSFVTNGQERVPDRYALLQNYPNPFNPVTTIEYHVPQAGNVRIDVFNILGRHVRVLLDRQTAPGVHRIQWDGRDKYGTPVGSGLYFYRMSSGSFTRSQKMLLMK